MDTSESIDNLAPFVVKDIPDVINTRSILLVLLNSEDKTAFRAISEPLTDCRTLEDPSDSARRNELAAVIEQDPVA